MNERAQECIEALIGIAETLGREGDEDSQANIAQLVGEVKSQFAAELDYEEQRASYNAQVAMGLQERVRELEAKNLALFTAVKNAVETGSPLNRILAALSTQKGDTDE